METKNIFLLLIFAVSQLSISAQNESCNYTLRGKVSDEHDSSPLSFSYIVNEKTKQVITADLDGNYVFTNLCKGLNYFIISHIGCESDTIAVQISQQNQVQDFQLEHHAKELATVWIEENKKSLHTLDASDLDNSRDGLVAEMMEKIPGVQSLSTGSNFSIPLVHGMSGNRLSIINNEIPLLYQQWGSEHSPEIDPFTINVISLVSGTEALKYSSGNIGGALVMSSSQKPIGVGIHGEVHSSFGSNKRMGSLAGTLAGRMKSLPELSWNIHADGKKAGNTKTPDYYLNNTGLEEMNYSANLKYVFQNSELEIGHSSFSSKIGIFPGSHISDLDELQHLIEEERPDEKHIQGFSYEIHEPFQKAEHQTSVLKYDLDINSRNKINLSFSRQNNKRSEYEDHEAHAHEEHEDENHDNSHEEVDETLTAYHLTSYRASANWKITSLKNHWTDFGIESIIAKNEVSGENKFIPAYKSNRYSAYGIRKWYMNKFTLDAGFRLDHSVMEISAIDRPILENFDKNFNSFSLSSGIEFNLNKYQDIKLNLSLAQRSPNINELYSEGIHHGTTSIENGNIKLHNENNHEISINYRLRKKKLWLNVFVYNKFITDYIYLENTGIDSNEHGIYLGYIWAQTDANYFGADFFMSYRIIEGLKIDVEASYLDAKKMDDSSPLSFIPANSVKSSLKYSLSDTEKLQNQYFQISVKQVAKQNKVPEDLLFDSPAAYALLNAGLGGSIKLGENKLSIAFEVKNLLDRKYRDYLDRFRYFSDSMGRDFRIHLSYSF